MNIFDRRVLLSGAFSGLFFALPAAIAQRTVFADAPLNGVMLFVIFFAGALAGYAAARPMPLHALMHGAAAGLITFLGPEAVYLFAKHEFPNPLSLIFGGLMFASLGTIGAYIAIWRDAQDAAKAARS
jgi:putative membrane protein (TIGR04086 family)